MSNKPNLQLRQVLALASIALCIALTTWGCKGFEPGARDRFEHIDGSNSAGASQSAALSKAVGQFRVRAKDGDPFAQLYLSYALATGVGVPPDKEQSNKWFGLAAGQGDAHLLNESYCSYEALENPKAHDPAVTEWFRVSAQNGITVWLRSAAQQGLVTAQYDLARMYDEGRGVPEDSSLAVRWYLEAAEQNLAHAQVQLARAYGEGRGVNKDLAEGVRWSWRAAENGVTAARFHVAAAYYYGLGVQKNYSKVVTLCLQAAEQGHKGAHWLLGRCYEDGTGVEQNYVQAYRWYNLAGALGLESARRDLSALEKKMSTAEVTLAQDPRIEAPPSAAPETDSGSGATVSTGSGFFISENGYFVTCAHVVEGATKLEIRIADKILDATVIRLDPADDLALLHCVGQFSAIHIGAENNVRLGDKVLTVGFPNPDLQGYSAKFSQGSIAGLTGPKDDPRLYQVSLPIQPGNSGGPLVNPDGEAIGVIVGRLNQLLALEVTGHIPENVNYAVKGTYLRGFLDADPELVPALAAPSSRPDPMNVTDAVHAACGLVIAYSQR